jgi:hypothetical protein
VISDSETKKNWSAFTSHYLEKQTKLHLNKTGLFKHTRRESLFITCCTIHYSSTDHCYRYGKKRHSPHKAFPTIMFIYVVHDAMTVGVWLLTLLYVKLKWKPFDFLFAEVFLTIWSDVFGNDASQCLKGCWTTPRYTKANTRDRWKINRNKAFVEEYTQHRRRCIHHFLLDFCGLRVAYNRADHIFRIRMNG